MRPTMELIELQTYMLSKGKTLLNELGQYKETGDVVLDISSFYNDLVEDEQKYLCRLLGVTSYNNIVEQL